MALQVGQIAVAGSVASGAVLTDNPVYIGGSDGTNVRPVLVDTSGRQEVVGAAAAGAALAGNPVQVGGTDGTNARAIGVNSVNQVLVNTQGQRATYRCAALALATVTAATDIAILPGSASKTVRVTRVGIGLTIDTAAQYVNVNLVKRSAADTGGTSGAMTVALMDSTNGPTTVSPLSFTGNPSLGAATNGGVIAAARYFAALSGTAAPTTQLVFEFGTANGQAVVLRGVAEGLAINLGTTSNSGVADLYYEWTEE